MYNYCMGKSTKWLNQSFLKWQTSTGKRQTLKAFAKYLNVNYQTLNSWLNRGNDPEGNNVHLLAQRLGDDIYSILGLTKPSFLLGDISGSLLLAGIDPEWVVAFVSAKAAAEIELSAKGISSNSPEGKFIAKNVFAKYGIDISLTE